LVDIHTRLVDQAPHQPQVAFKHGTVKQRLRITSNTTVATPHACGGFLLLLLPSAFLSHFNLFSPTQAASESRLGCLTRVSLK
jgi:hypothetical protein